MSANPRPVIFFPGELRALEQIRRLAGLFMESVEATGGDLGTSFVLALDSVDHLIDRARAELDPHSRRTDPPPDSSVLGYRLNVRAGGRPGTTLRTVK